MKNLTHQDNKLGLFEVAILILTLLVLAGWVLDTITVLPHEVSQLIHWMDTAVCAVFLVDFVIRFHRAESKLAFMKWGWIDLIASIPNVDFLRWGRLVRVLRIIRLIRAIRSVQRILHLLFRSSAETGFVSIGLTAFLMVVFSSVAILICERSPESNIKGAEDALWWSMTTMTTVGYGDRYPVTTEGRIVGMIVMTAGIGLFGGLSGLVASFLLGAREKESPENKEILERLERLQRALDEMNAKSNSLKL